MRCFEQPKKVKDDKVDLKGLFLEVDNASPLRTHKSLTRLDRLDTCCFMLVLSSRTKQERYSATSMEFNFNCETCGAPVNRAEPAGFHAEDRRDTLANRLCVDCLRAHYRKAYARKVEKGGTCQLCDERYEGFRSSGICVRCSRKVGRYEHVCDNCGDVFRSNKRWERLCSPACRKEHAAEEAAEYRESVRQMILQSTMGWWLSSSYEDCGCRIERLCHHRVTYLTLYQEYRDEVPIEDQEWGIRDFQFCTRLLFPRTKAKATRINGRMQSGIRFLRPKREGVA